MKAKDLRNSILQLAVQGKLVPQDPNDEPASVLLERIRDERAKLIKEKKIKAPKGGESIIYRASDGSHYEKRGKGEPVCIDDEIPFEIPESWAWVRLGSILELVSDGTHKTPEYKDSGVLFLSVQNVSRGYFDLSKVKYVSQEAHDELCKRVKPRNRDILLCRIGTLGKPIIVNVDYEFSIFVSLGLLRLIDERLAEWVVACIDAPIGFQWIQRVKVGGGTHTFKINLGDIPDFLIPLPPYEEQLRIQEKLSAILDHVGEYEELQATRERADAELPDRLRKSILQLAVQGKLVGQDPADEPASVLLDRIRAERATLVKAGKLKASKGGESVIYRASDGGYYEKRGKGEPVCIDDEIPFEIPESWEWARLSVLIDLISGVDLDSSQYNDCHKGMPYLTGASNFDNGNLIENRWTDQPKRISTRGDLLFTCKGTVGAMAINTFEEAHIARQIMAVKPMNVMTLGYIEVFLMSMIEHIKLRAKGVIPGIERNTILDALIPMPSLDEQRRIVGNVYSLLSMLG